MRSDVAALLRKTKISIPAARLVGELKSSRSGEFIFKAYPAAPIFRDRQQVRNHTLTIAVQKG